MTKAELMCYIGKKVSIYLKYREKSICGTLGYVDEFSEKYGYRKPNYFYIGNTIFKVSYVRKLVLEAPTIIEADKKGDK